MSGVSKNDINHQINSNGAWQMLGHRLTGGIYGFRHFAKLSEDSCSSLQKARHFAIGIFECIPVIGSVIAAVEGKLAGISFWDTFIHSNNVPCDFSRSNSATSGDWNVREEIQSTKSFEYNNCTYSLQEWPSEDVHKLSYSGIS